jgi:hypothetical protein
VRSELGGSAGAVLHWPEKMVCVVVSVYIYTQVSQVKKTRSQKKKKKKNKKTRDGFVASPGDASRSLSPTSFFSSDSDPLFQEKS